MLPCDLSDSSAVEALVPAAEAAMGRLDMLVNNAGVTRDNLFVRMKDAEWDTVISINLTAAFRLARASLRGMIRRRHGRIIAITSVVGVTGNPGQGNYAAAKAGLIGMSKALAAEVASRGITVNCVAPGFIASPMTDALNEKQRAAILAEVPIGRLGAASDIGAAVDIFGERGGRLHHRPDAARQRRNGNDLKQLRDVIPCPDVDWSTSRLAKRDMLSSQFVLKKATTIMFCGSLRKDRAVAVGGSSTRRGPSEGIGFRRWRQRVQIKAGPFARSYEGKCK